MFCTKEVKFSRVKYINLMFREMDIEIFLLFIINFNYLKIKFTYKQNLVVLT